MLLRLRHPQAEGNSQRQLQPWQGCRPWGEVVQPGQWAGRLLLRADPLQLARGVPLWRRAKRTRGLGLGLGQGLRVVPLLPVQGPVPVVAWHLPLGQLGRRSHPHQVQELRWGQRQGPVAHRRLRSGSKICCRRRSAQRGRLGLGIQRMLLLLLVQRVWGRGRCWALLGADWGDSLCGLRWGAGACLSRWRCRRPPAPVAEAAKSLRQRLRHVGPWDKQSARCRLANFLWGALQPLLLSLQGRRPSLTRCLRASRRREMAGMGLARWRLRVLLRQGQEGMGPRAFERRGSGGRCHRTATCLDRIQGLTLTSQGKERMRRSRWRRAGRRLWRRKKLPP